MADRPYKSLSDAEISYLMEQVNDIEDQISYSMKQVNDIEDQISYLMEQVNDIEESEKPSDERNQKMNLPD